MKDPKGLLCFAQRPPFVFGIHIQHLSPFPAVRSVMKVRLLHLASCPFTILRSGVSFQWPKKNCMTDQVQEAREKGEKCRKKGFPFLKKSSQFIDTGWKQVNCNWEFVSKALRVKTKWRHMTLYGNTISYLWNYTCPIPSYGKVSLSPWGTMPNSVELLARILPPFLTRAISCWKQIHVYSWPERELLKFWEANTGIFCHFATIKKPFKWWKYPSTAQDLVRTTMKWGAGWRLSWQELALHSLTTVPS